MTISISISCEEDELPALRAALASLVGGLPGTLKSKLLGIPLTEAQRAEILRLRSEEGMNIAQIKEATGIKSGRWINSVIQGQQFKLRQERKAKEKVKPSQTDSKSISRAALNGLIWDLHKNGKNNEEISDELYKQGYCFSADFVRERLKKIEEGRA